MKRQSKKHENFQESFLYTIKDNALRYVFMSVVLLNLSLENEFENSPMNFLFFDNHSETNEIILINAFMLSCFFFLQNPLQLKRDQSRSFTLVLKKITGFCAVLERDEMEEFKLYRKKPNAISFGRLYTAKMVVPFDNKKRTIRVWVPDCYDENDTATRYPTLYMCDGQNMVDEYTTAYGEWNLDEVAERLIFKGARPFLLVGVDCPCGEMERASEMAVPGIFRSSMKDLANYDLKGEVYVDFFFNTLKPRIDRMFHTDPRKEYTGFGGSSMGGLMSFYGFVRHREKIGFCLCFSPGFCIYRKPEFQAAIKAWNPDPKEYGMIYLYSGGKGFERIFPRPTEFVYKHLLSKGFSRDQTAFVYDSNAIHHESAWNQYAYGALKFWLDSLK